MVRCRGNIGCWNKPLDVCWLSSLYLKQSSVIYCVILNLLLIKLFLRTIGHSLFELVYGEQVRLPVDIILGK